MNDEIKVSRLTKIYRTSKGDTPVRAVDDIDFAVYKGEVFGFLGPNGAGKTTTINMLTGLARPDAGIIQIDGTDCRKTPRAARLNLPTIFLLGGPALPGKWGDEETVFPSNPVSRPIFAFFEKQNFKEVLSQLRRQHQAI